MTDFFFPPNVRRYSTFRVATVVAALAALATALLRSFVRFPRETITRLESRNLLHSPLIFGLFCIFVAVVFYVVHATRYRGSWYIWRVWVYCMVFGGALIALVDLIFPPARQLTSVQALMVLRDPLPKAAPGNFFFLSGFHYP